jgi:hypothetical protein
MIEWPMFILIAVLFMLALEKWTAIALRLMVLHYLVCGKETPSKYNLSLITLITYPPSCYPLLAPLACRSVTLKLAATSLFQHIYVQRLALASVLFNCGT